LDRLSRRLKDGVTTLADWSEKNIRVVVVKKIKDVPMKVKDFLPSLVMTATSF
jgi:hypothetical protein